MTELPQLLHPDVPAVTAVRGDVDEMMASHQWKAFWENELEWGIAA